MSADLFLQLLINLQMYGLLCPGTTELCKERMVAGLLLAQSKKQAYDLLEEFDANRDGVFDSDEIKEMNLKVNRGTIERLNATEEKAERLLIKAKEKQAAKALKDEGDESESGRKGVKAHARAKASKTAPELPKDILSSIPSDTYFLCVLFCFVLGDVRRVHRPHPFYH